MKVEDLGMEPHHKAFLLSSTSHLMDIPIKDFLNGVNSDECRELMIADV
jgi:hypothetical protein